ENRSQQLRRFIESSKYENLPSWVGLMEEFGSEYDVVDEFIDRELELEEAYYPDEDDLDLDEDEMDDDPLFRAARSYDDDDDDEFDDDLFPDLEEIEEDDEFSQGEDWKMLSDEFA
ncbi:hypothetical protein RZS08_54140, partial [Arthrospira platensis SPKY1]|nr:hypothetical protein [Arthrospira platensis SPKY1]